MLSLTDKGFHVVGAPADQAEIIALPTVEEARRELAVASPIPAQTSVIPAQALAILNLIGMDFLVRPGAAYIADADGRVLWGNAAWNEFAAERLIMANSPVEFIPWPADEFRGHTVSGRVQSREDSFMTREGRSHLHSHHWAAIDARRNFVGVAGLLILPSPQNRLRKQNIALQERLEDLTRLVSDGIWETGPTLEFTTVSARIGEIAGYHPRELLGKMLGDFGSFVDAAGHETTSPLDAERPQPFRDRAFILRDAQGVCRHFRIAGLPTFDEKGRFGGYRGTARDVTGEALALGLVAQSRSQLTQAIESISEGFALFDSTGRLLLWNKHYLAAMPQTAPSVHVGISYQELIGMAFARGDIAPIALHEQVRALDIVGRARKQLPIEFQLSDGRWMRATDRFTADGSIVGIRTDITDAKRREMLLVEAKDAAESANRAKSEFLANVSHELRTPLNAIIGFSELMLSEVIGPIGNPQYKSYLKDVLLGGRHLLDVINDILELARAESGSLELNREILDVGDLVENILRPMRERALRADLRLTSKVEVNLPSIEGDPRKLRQILLNLVSNAIKFTPAQGIVTVTASRGEHNCLLLRVIDTGIGMSKSDIDVAFRPFGQVDGSLARKFEGAGLGLPLTRAIVELHGGTTDIESARGSGTTITIKLPTRRFSGAA